MISLETTRPAVDLEVVIPAHNERDRLTTSLVEITGYLAAQPYRSAVVVVDNGSTDGTPDVVTAFRSPVVPVHLVSCRDIGKGAAVRHGVLTSSATYVGFSDADLATPIESLDNVMPLLHYGCKIVIASRHVDGAAVVHRQPMLRRLGGWVFHKWASMVVPGVSDTQCGFKFFDRAAVEDIFRGGRLVGFAFDLELMALAVRNHLSIAEVPVAWTHSGGSSFRIVRDGVHVLFEMVRLSKLLARTSDVSEAVPLHAGS